MGAARTAWVTGAAGFIGCNLSSALRAAGWTVVGLDRNADPEYVQVAGDITAPVLDAALAAHGAPGLVFHGAGTGSVGESARDLDASRRDLVGATETLLEFLRTFAPSARFVFPSSAAVYGNSAALREDARPDPISPYGQHKLAAEQACIAAAAHGLSVAVVRLFSVYGPGLRKQLPWDLGRKLTTGEPRVTLFGTGAETRDFLNVDDVAGLVMLLADSRFTSPLIINGGTGIATRIDGFAAQFAEILGSTAKVVFNGEIRPGDPQHYRADTTRLAALGFRPQIDLPTGLARYAAWMKTQA